MEQNKILMTIGAIIITFILLFGVYKLTNQPVQTDFPEINKITANDHIMWSTDKKNILVEYSDYQCPGCKNIHNILTQFSASGSADLDITKKVTLVFRHYPLSQIHPSSIIASYAAEAAGKQGKFNEMSDLLFNEQEKWDKSENLKEYFNNLAKILSLNISQFNKDMDSKEIKEKVDSDITSGDKGRIDETPSFFLNGKKMDRITNIDDFKKILRNL
jgi:protein-disulfide isomerase